MWKGQYSEKLVNDKISKLSDEYVIFNDLLFESNGRSTQIDRKHSVNHVANFVN